MKLLRRRAGQKGTANEIANATRLERAGGLEVFEFEENAAVCGLGEGGGFDERGWYPGLGERFKRHVRQLSEFSCRYVNEEVNQN